MQKEPTEEIPLELEKTFAVEDKRIRAPLVSSHKYNYPPALPYPALTIFPHETFESALLGFSPEAFKLFAYLYHSGFFRHNGIPYESETGSHIESWVGFDSGSIIDAFIELRQAGWVQAFSCYIQDDELYCLWVMGLLCEGDSYNGSLSVKEVEQELPSRPLPGQRFIVIGTRKLSLPTEYEDYLLSDHWQKKRLKALEKAEHKCERCGTTERLQVHHLSYKNLGCEPLEDLQVLCHKCHAELHGIEVE